MHWGEILWEHATLTLPVERDQDRRFLGFRLCVFSSISIPHNFLSVEYNNTYLIMSTGDYKGKHCLLSVLCHEMIHRASKLGLVILLKRDELKANENANTYFFHICHCLHTIHNISNPISHLNHFLNFSC